MTHDGLATMSRPPVLPQLPALTPTNVNYLTPVPAESSNVWLTSTGRQPLQTAATITSSLITARLTGRAMLTVRDSLVAAMLDGIGFDITGSRIGSIDLPNGQHRSPSEDGIRPCPLPYSPRRPLGSRIADSDIVNTDVKTTAHQDGVQIWMGGRVLLQRCRIVGWWQSAVMLKSDWGRIDDVVIDGCHLAGANYFQVRVIDGTYGRPTNVTITNNVFEVGTKGGAFPMNSGDDLCRVSTQTRYVRRQSDRVDPEWIVFDGNVYPDGTEVVPPGGWFIG